MLPSDFFALFETLLTKNLQRVHIEYKIKVYHIFVEQTNLFILQSP